MIDDDDNYELDADGKRVLIGLSAQETDEFIRLDHVMGETSPLPDIASDTWARFEDRRWLELFEKHEAARRPFMAAGKTKH